MESDCGTSATGPCGKNPICGLNFLRALQPLLFGLAVTLIALGLLDHLREPRPSLIWLFDVIFIALVQPMALTANKPSPTGCLLFISTPICVAILLPFFGYTVAPILLGAVFAAHSAVFDAAAEQKRPFLWAGYLASAVFPLWFHWPNQQRCMLVLAGVGVVTALQGAWFFVRYLQKKQPLNPPKVVWSEGEDRALIRSIHWMFGRIEHTQILSTDLNQRIQERYKLEIDSLHRLGFSDGFHDAEGVSLLQALNPFLAIVLFLMWRTKEVMAFWPRLQISNCHPILLAPGHDPFAFAYMSALGTSLYTSFEDKTLLVTKNYGDDDRTPPGVVVKHCKGASVVSIWESHQNSVSQFREEGKKVVCDTSYRAFVEMSYRETAPW